MDTIVQLAIMGKLEAALSDAGEFLCYPQIPLVFEIKPLAEAIAGTDTGLELQIVADFTRALNRVPTAGRFLPNDGEFLWDVLADLFARKVIFAEGLSGDKAESDRERAHAVLFSDVDMQGVPKKSELYKKYEYFRDSYLVLAKAMKLREIEIERSDNEEERREWETKIEPLLRMQLKSIEADWNVIGRRKVVESALSTLSQIDASRPDQRWHSGANRLKMRLDARSDLNSAKFVPTSISPINFILSDAWMRFRLDANDVGYYWRLAPEEFRNRYKPTAAPDKNLEVEFEFTLVQILRDWFEPGMFNSRNWQFSNPKIEISDGMMPPYGVLPGYAKSAIFIRNVNVRPNRNSSAGEKRPLPVFDELDFETSNLPDLSMDEIKPSLPNGSPLDPVTDPLPPELSNFKKHLDQFDRRLMLNNVNSSAKERNELQWYEPQRRTKEAKVAYSGGRMGILGFICHAFPKSPDPDPMLAWPPGAIQRKNPGNSLMGKFGPRLASGSCEFDYSTYDGKVIVGSGARRFVLSFSKCSNECIYVMSAAHVNGSNVKKIARVKNARAGTEINFNNYDSSSSLYKVQVGERVICQNANGYFMQIRIDEIDDDRVDVGDNVKFVYEIYESRSPIFQAL